MAHILRNSLQVTPASLYYQQVRYSAKINLKKPRAPHFKKALIETFIKPVFATPMRGKPQVEQCKKTLEVKRERTLNTYELILTRELVGRFKNAQMIGFVHQNSINQDKLYDFQVRLKKENMWYKTYSFPICSEALRQANLEDAIPLIRSSYGLVFSEEIKVAPLQKALKKTPQLFLIAGVIQNQVLDLEDFLKYGSLSMTDVQSGLVSLLQNAGGLNLTRQLNQHQTTFIDRLTAIQNRGSEGTGKAPDKA